MDDAALIRRAGPAYPNVASALAFTGTAGSWQKSHNVLFWKISPAYIFRAKRV
jgi:hypothetical protein